MRNLKKILALALAFVMSLSLMATAGATDFQDDGDVSDIYRQAVEVLSELGVFNGDQDGKFNPDKSITRAEVAAIIYRIATGDVTNERNDTYTPYKQFPDVIAGDWYAGYVTYCANAGYIKGRNTGNFDPKDPVTGYEVLAMILRAVGYDKNDEFTGGNWQEHTASLATQKGVLKNITSSTSLRAEATRETVAELLFQAMLLPQVTYNSATLSYDANRDSLAKENLGLEELTGVVMANKWADLESDTVLKDGLTRLDVDGKDYTLNIDTPITAIGEMRHAYVQNGTDVIGNLTEGDLEDAGISIVAEPENRGGKGTKVDTLAKDANLKLTADTEYFVNFGEGEYYTSEWQIRYSVTFTDYTIDGVTRNGKNDFAEWYTDINEAQAAINERLDNQNDWLLKIEGEDTYERVIRAGEEITGYDLLIMQGIFQASANSTGTAYNGINGSVRIGTNQQNTNFSSAEIVSNNHSWNQFFNEYIENNATNYTQNDNGEWLKIVDKDGDGIADYVLRTDFVMTTVVDVDTTENSYILEYRNPVTTYHVEMPFDEINFVTEGLESLVEGDVILYTYIDGVYHVAIPEVEAKATMAKASDANLKTNVVTFDVGEKEWSGIDKQAAYYKSDIAAVQPGVSYSLYYDHFGYVRLFAESSKDFVLLTDGYYNTDLKNVNTFMAEIYDLADDTVKDVDANDNVWLGNRDRNTGLINTTEDADTLHNTTGHGNRGTWKRLNTFGFYNYEVYQGSVLADRTFRYNVGNPVHPYLTFRSSFYTNVAAYDVTEDGVYNLYDVYDANTYGDDSDVLHNAYTIAVGGSADDAVTGQKVEIARPTASSRTLWGVVTWNWDDKSTPADPSDDVYTPAAVQRVHTTAATRYYWVTYAASDVDHNNPIVKTWVGFNAPSDLNWDTREGNIAYVVTSTVEVDGQRTAYETAEVVVLEGSVADSIDYYSGGIAAQGNTPTGEKTHQRSGEIVPPTVLYMMGWNGSEYTTDIQNRYVDAAGNSRYVDYGMLWFYGLDDPETNYWNLVTEKYYDYHFYAGYVVTERGTDNKPTTPYGVLNKADNDDIRAVDVEGKDAYWHGTESYYDPASTPVYKFTKVTSEYGRVGYDWTTSTITYGDKVLYITDADGDAQMIFNVTESINMGNAEIAGKLEALWIHVQQDYQEAHVTYKDVAHVVFQVMSGNEIIDVTPTFADPEDVIQDKAVPSSGNVTVTLPTGVPGWDWTAPGAGSTAGSIKVTTGTTTVTAVNWAVLTGGGTLQLQNVSANKTYVVTLIVTEGSTKRHTVEAAASGSNWTRLTDLPAGSGGSPAINTFFLSNGISKDVYYAVETPAIASFTGDNDAVTISSTVVSKADLPEAEQTAAADLPANKTYTFYKVTFTGTSKAQATVTLSIAAAANYDMTIYGATETDNEAFTPVSAAGAGKIDAGTALNAIKITADVDAGWKLITTGADDSRTLIMMGSTRLNYTVAYDENNKVTISITDTVKISDDITVTLRTEANTGTGVEDQVNEIEGLTVSRDRTAPVTQEKWDFVLSPSAADGIEYIDIEVPAGTPVVASGEASDAGAVTLDGPQANPFVRTGSGNVYWQVTINKSLMKTTAKLTFEVTIGNAPAAVAPEVTGSATITRTTGADAVTDGATIDDTTVNGTDGTGAGDETVYEYDLGSLAATGAGKISVTIGTVTKEVTLSVGSLAASDIADGIATAFGSSSVPDGIETNPASYWAVTADSNKVVLTSSAEDTEGVIEAAPALSITTTNKAAVKDKYVIDLTGVSVTGNSGGTLTVAVFGNEYELTVTGDMNAAAIATALAGAIDNLGTDTTGGAWTVTASGNTVVVEATNEGEITTALATTAPTLTAALAADDGGDLGAE